MNRVAATAGDGGLDEKVFRPFLGKGERYQKARSRGGGPLTVERLIEHLPLVQGSGEGQARPLEDLAESMLEGKITSDPEISEDKRLEFLNGWLRFVTSNTPLARMRWAALAAGKKAELKDRDAYALRLWQRIVTGTADDRGLVAYAESNWAPWDYYERHFFGWFLSRFDLRRARQVFGPSPLARWLNLILLAAALVIAALALHPVGAAPAAKPARQASARGAEGTPPAQAPGPDFERSMWVLMGAGAVLATGGLCLRRLRLPLHAYLNSLIPRLAATVGIGYLFLVNAPQIVRFVVVGLRCEALWLATGLLLLAAFGYITLHISRRVHPALALGALLSRSLDLWLLAVSYAVLGLVVVAPVLFSSEVLQLPAAALHPLHLAVVAAIALNLGVVLQLAWDEKPLTEPL